MKIIIAPSVREIGKLSAEQIAKRIIQKPDLVLGLATGSSVLETYKYISNFYASRKLSLSSVHTVNLDEYCGLEKENVNSFRYFMEKELFEKTNIDPKHIEFLDGTAKDPVQECRRYERRIEQIGPVDLQILGIGNNGHIAFNEPAEVFSDGVVEVELTKETIEVNSRFFSCIDEVPKKALTMGSKLIARAKEIIMIAYGEKKAEAVYQMIHGPVHPELPASILQDHENFTLYIDSAIADYMKKNTVH